MSKFFTNMDSAERSAWIDGYKKWLAEEKPDIESAVTLTAALRGSMEKGFALMSAFPFCKAFADESLKFKDYLRRRSLMFRYLDRITVDVQRFLGDSGSVDLTDPKLLRKHVGRPTKDEVAARHLAAERRRKEEENKEETLFGKKADLPKDVPIDAATVSGSAVIGSRLHLDQLRWLLSERMQEAVDTVRDLRGSAAEASTRAKQMALDGRKPEEIEPYARTAAEDTEAYENIYAQVDVELAKVYVRLKEDTTYRNGIIARGVDPQELRTVLRPYWDKAGEWQQELKQQVIDDINANDPEQAAMRKEKEEKKAKSDAIIKYLCRKDKSNTAKRISTMTSRYAELETLIGEEAKTYLPVLEAAKADYEEHYVKPKAEE